MTLPTRPRRKLHKSYGKYGTYKQSEGYQNKDLPRKQTDTNKDNDDVWSSEINIIENPEIKVPKELASLVEDYQEEVGREEFSILVKGEWTETGFEIKDLDHIVPEQEVSRTSVDYQEDLVQYRDNGYNVVIHTHPFSSKGSFSGTDDRYINTTFPCSILYTEQFDDAILNLRPDGITSKIRIDAEVVETSPDHDQEVDTENINKKQSTTSTTYSYYTTNNDDDDETYSEWNTDSKETYERPKGKHVNRYYEYKDNYDTLFDTYREYNNFLDERFPEIPEDISISEWIHMTKPDTNVSTEKKVWDLKQELEKSDSMSEERFEQNIRKMAEKGNTDIENVENLEEFMSDEDD